ncbi:MAG: hypothetical protein Q7R85_04695 [bacterium]|nr:hypothetical protein [bacterium]
MANEPKESAKPEVQDPRDVSPVSARETMWRAVKLYAWLATLLVAVWGLWLLTVWVYKQPPSCPPNPLKDASVYLDYGMSEEEVSAIIKSHTHNPSTGQRYGHGLDCEPAVYCDENRVSGLHVENGSVVMIATARLKIVRWEWIGNAVPGMNGGWSAYLSLAFEDNALCSANYSDVWISHVRERPMEYRVQRKK